MMLSPSSRTLRGRMGRLSRALAAATALAAAMLAAQPTARADAAEIACSFLEIRASNDSSGIDPKLKPLSKKLTRPPLSSWKSFKLVKQHDRKLASMKAEDIALEVGGKLNVLYRHTQGSGKTARFSLDLTLDAKNGKRTLDTKVTMDAGDYFAIAYSPTADSGDLLALTCKKP